jgi:hypothetical protein
MSKKRRQNSQNPSRTLRNGANAARHPRRYVPVRRLKLLPHNGKLLTTNSLIYSALFLYFLWTSSNGLGAFLEWSSNAVGLTQRVAESFSLGQLHFKELPSSELLKLSDPYDPSLNSALRLHDASLYDGKYFSYFGPVVPLLIVLPLFKMFGGFAPDALLTSVFALILVLTASKIIGLFLEVVGWEIKKRYQHFIPIFFGFASGLPFMLRRSAVYEVVILSSIVFLFLFIYLALSYFLLPKKVNVARALLASLFFSLALANRPNIAISGLLFLASLTILIFVRKNNRIELKNVYKFFACFLPIVGVTLVLMGWYNFARFGSVIEFGNRYQLAGMHVGEEELRGLKFIPIGIFGYLFTSPKFELNFPFFRLLPQSVPVGGDFKYFPEPNLGLFGTLFGVFSIVFLCWAYRYRSNLELLNRISFTKVSSPLLVASFTGLLLDVYLIAGTTYRYTLDFLPLYLLAVIPIVLKSLQTENSFAEPLTKMLKILTWISILHVIVVNFFIGFEGYLNSFMISNEPAYLVFKNIFEFPFFIVTKLLGGNIY